jgi:hypothetical protein
MAELKVHSFTMARGDDRTLTYVVKDQQDTPVVVDITGALIEWTLAKQDPAAALDTDPQPARNSTLKTKSTSTSGVTITDGANGEFEVSLASADTVGLSSPGKYYHEIQMTLSGVGTTLVQGIITLKRDIIAPGP